MQPMPVTPEELAQQAMGLSAEARAELANLLVESLDVAQIGKIDQAWLAEAKRRRDEVRTGSATTVSSIDAMKRARDALKR